MASKGDARGGEGSDAKALVWGHAHRVAARVVGALVLGPHMYVVGSRARRAAEEEEAAAAQALADEAALQKRYAEVSNEEAAQILSAACEKADRAAEEAELEARRAEGEARKKMSLARRQLADANLAARKCSNNLLLVQGSRLGLKKFTSLPEPTRSSAAK